jgi:flagellar assembly protein FliH
VGFTWQRVTTANRKETETAQDKQREQTAYERGLAEGEKRLSEQLLRQRGELLELQNGVLTSLREAVPRVVRQSESALIQLTLEVASKLISGLPVSTDMVEAAVRSALAQVQEATEFHVYLHADDLTLLQQCNSPVLLPGPGHDTVRFDTSADVTRGGCLVETRFGVIDARRETKLDLIRQSLGQ